jgi:hypothetical protein
MRSTIWNVHQGLCPGHMVELNSGHFDNNWPGFVVKRLGGPMFLVAIKLLVRNTRTRPSRTADFANNSFIRDVPDHVSVSGRSKSVGCSCTGPETIDQ